MDTNTHDDFGGEGDGGGGGGSAKSTQQAR